MGIAPSKTSRSRRTTLLGSPEDDVKLYISRRASTPSRKSSRGRSSRKTRRYTLNGTSKHDRLEDEEALLIKERPRRGRSFSSASYYDQLLVQRQPEYEYPASLRSLSPDGSISEVSGRSAVSSRSSSTRRHSALVKEVRFAEPTMKVAGIDPFKDRPYARILDEVADWKYNEAQDRRASTSYVAAK